MVNILQPIIVCGHGIPFIGTDGKVVPCCIVGVPETWTMGDLTHQKINDIWNNDLYISLRKQLITGEIPNTCKPCYN